MTEKLNYENEKCEMCQQQKGASKISKYERNRISEHYRTSQRRLKTRKTILLLLRCVNKNASARLDAPIRTQARVVSSILGSRAERRFRAARVLFFNTWNIFRKYFLRLLDWILIKINANRRRTYRVSTPDPVVSNGQKN